MPPRRKYKNKGPKKGANCRKMLINYKQHILLKSKKEMKLKQGSTEQNPLTSYKNDTKHSNVQTRKTRK